MTVRSHLQHHGCQGLPVCQVGHHRVVNALVFRRIVLLTKQDGVHQGNLGEMIA